MANERLRVYHDGSIGVVDGFGEVRVLVKPLREGATAHLFNADGVAMASAAVSIDGTATLSLIDAEGFAVKGFRLAGGEVAEIDCDQLREQVKAIMEAKRKHEDN